MKDQLSALLDGDLDDQSSRTVVDSMCRDAALRDKWDKYCLIGDVLRGERAGAPDFASRVMERLHDEPTLLAPARRDGATADGEGRVRRAALPVAASVMGAAAVGMLAYTFYPRSDDAGMLTAAASRAQAVEASARQGLAVVAGERQDSHREYVFVHQAMNGGGPIPGAVQYVRTVSDVRGDIRR
ncbi:MAG TPA: sigma-E factor negative regulatory protein [Rhodocyclaceae bacterium]|nr:sigma-E factor negative regulatory protein [Rhodocyclaceae bacterium]